MGGVDARTIKEYDELAAAIGDTPKYNNNGEVIAVGAAHERGKVYVVWVGRVIGLFNNWGLASAMTNSFPGYILKGCTDLNEAREAWLKGPSALPTWRAPQRPRPPIPTPQESACAVSNDDGPSDSRPAVLVVPSTPLTLRMPPAALEESTALSDEADGPPPSIKAAPRTPRMPRIKGQPSGAKPIPRALTADVAPSPSTPSSPSRARDSCAIPMTLISTALSSRDGRESPELSYEQAQARKGELVFVVVRGDRPGIYFDRTTALNHAGTRPGMKVVALKSLARASWYFTQQCMKNRVGIPVVNVSDGED
ncbi:hypothetical protein PYCCODRAFT_1470022 [Trametes coccinea BRFM310]|uniref:Ribonuclease H1 N-terminal domain-containing protein n=1 Tax=Trametes coccinea (strain BRFM310) TaxID=1353009 RepID=A0A1Y2IGQ1_TRAC3|nr:hypothetical protein PYCCODRAFT_1470022 [Trametes coccinea BRFM310]